ncbi:MAG: DUF1232 domain-containing protein [Vicinamibacterales bacterium]
MAMVLRPTSWLMRPWKIATLWREMRLGTRLLREPAVPLWAKATLPFALLYLVSPVDILPDVIPGLGEMDDLVILYAALQLFLRVSPSIAVRFHQSAIERRQKFSAMPPSDVVIDADFTREG